MKRLDWKITLFAFFLCALLSIPKPALATQEHAAGEGIAAHLFAHAIFFSSMLYLCFRLIREKTTLHSGWRWILFSSFFFCLWNAQAIFVHCYLAFLPADAFLGRYHSLSESFHVRSVLDLLYYFGRFDHLLSVPALLFLLVGIRSLMKSQGETA
jgi:hypothetical protein